MPKVNRNGKAEIISKETLKAILEDESILLKHRTLIAVCFFTAGRIGEVCQIKKADIGSHVTFEPKTTKTKKTRQVLISPQLRTILDRYIATLPSEQVYLFSSEKSGRRDKYGNKTEYYSKDTAGKVLDKIFSKYGLEGCSTHSFRRSVLTHAHQSGASLADLQQLSGHSSLQSLQQYLQCSDNAQAKVLSLVEF